MLNDKRKKTCKHYVCANNGNSFPLCDSMSMEIFFGWDEKDQFNRKYSMDETLCFARSLSLSLLSLCISLSLSSSILYPYSIGKMSSWPNLSHSCSLFLFALNICTVMGPYEYPIPFIMLRWYNKLIAACISFR